MANENVTVDRSYVDNYDVKKFVKDTLIPKYFPDVDVSLRTVGMVGMTSELISNIAEDSFNATSVLFREAFPNRAEIPESIYSHASIFQLSNIFSTASSCSFLIVLEEDSIIKNMVYDPTSMMYYFYLDKNTTVYVENVPYTLDYDIRIRGVKKKTAKSEQYIFTASYVLDDYTNSISDITDPYIKIRRSSSGFLALEVRMHQITRDVQYESIVTNSKINMPCIDISFDGQLVGFDVLYKTPTESTYKTQMTKLLAYSQPVSTPFCYYQLYNDTTLRLTFNDKDSYFTPEFNSELKVILYLSKGKDANFDVYNGTNITIEPDNSVYNYDHSIVMAAKTLTGSYGGADRLGLDDLQALTIEGYRTALALTTESDLTTFFTNYEQTHNDFAIKFIKRRNDVYERIFGGYCVMRNDSDIFKTNTLDLHMNLDDMDNPESNIIYMIEPGTLFTYQNDNDDHLGFYRDDIKTNQFYNEYIEAVNKNEIPFVESSDPDIPEYIAERSASFATFKARKGYTDKVHVFDKSYDELNILDDYTNGKFVFMNPFLIRFKKSPNLVSLYQTFIDSKSVVDFTNQNDDTFVQFVDYQLHVTRSFDRNKEYTVTTSVMPSITLDNAYPIVNRIGTDINKKPIYNLNNRYTVDQNDLRVLFVIYDDNTPICYSEMYPTEFLDDTTVVYETKFSSDDHITTDNKLRLNDGVIYLVTCADEINAEYPAYGGVSSEWYFKVDHRDGTKYQLYDNSGNLAVDNISVDDVTELINKSYVKKVASLVRMTKQASGGIFIPMENVTCKVFTLYRRKYWEDGDTASLILTNHEDTDNMFVTYDGTAEKDYADSTYDTYVWTNEYSTITNPITFIRPLNHVRSHLYFEDYTAKNPDGSYMHDIMDVRMESLPFIRWNLAYEPSLMAAFMDTFNNQYDAINTSINSRLRNETSIDFKFYNTYGRSTNYVIGDDDVKLQSLNLRIAFDMWFIQGTDTTTVIPEIKQFIKSKIETTNVDGTNEVYISNLMREIEHTFSYVHHIRFRGFNNDLNAYHQSIKLNHVDMNEMTKEERRKYVPELLVIDKDDIIITEYTV